MFHSNLGSAKGYWTKQGNYYLVPDVIPNKDRLLTVNHGRLDGAQVEWRLVDPKAGNTKAESVILGAHGGHLQLERV